MKTFKDFYEAVVNVVQRKKLQRRMAKMAKSPVIQMKKKRAMLKMRNPAKLNILARIKGEIQWVYGEVRQVLKVGLSSYQLIQMHLDQWEREKMPLPSVVVGD